MKPIAFSKEETRAMVSEIQAYFRSELDQEIGGLGAEMLLDFIGREVGGYFYNRGLEDARTLVAARMEDLTDAIAGLERQTRFVK